MNLIRHEEARASQKSFYLGGNMIWCYIFSSFADKKYLDCFFRNVLILTTNVLALCLTISVITVTACLAGSVAMSSIYFGFNSSGK
jgi:hypothetical protein